MLEYSLERFHAQVVPECHRKPVKSISFVFSVSFFRFHLVILPVILVVALDNYLASRNTLSLVMLGSGSAAAGSNPKMAGINFPVAN